MVELFRILAGTPWTRKGKKAQDVSFDSHGLIPPTLPVLSDSDLRPRHLRGDTIHSSARNWRPYRESNPGYHRERVVS